MRGSGPQSLKITLYSTNFYFFNTIHITRKFQQHSTRQGDRKYSLLDYPANMGKRKRNTLQEDQEELPFLAGGAKKNRLIYHEGATPVTFQIVLGTYEKVLHGITASITSQPAQHREQNCVEFADTFLLNAHTSAIRCLAVRMFRSNLSLSIADLASLEIRGPRVEDHAIAHVLQPVLLLLKQF